MYEFNHLFRYLNLSNLLNLNFTLTSFVSFQVSTLVLKPSQMAIICLSFAKYAVEPFVSECEPPTALVKLVAVISIGKVSILFCRYLHEGNIVIKLI